MQAAVVAAAGLHQAVMETPELVELVAVVRLEQLQLLEPPTEVAVAVLARQTIMHRLVRLAVQELLLLVTQVQRNYVLVEL
jgi:hypothetical protein